MVITSCAWVPRGTHCSGQVLFERGHPANQVRGHRSGSGDTDALFRHRWHLELLSEVLLFLKRKVCFIVKYRKTDAKRLR